MKMAVLEILTYPHPLLKKRCLEVEKIDEEVKRLIHDMTETMYEANGVGLAACQVGVNKRVIVLDVSPMDPEQDLFALINPEIVAEEEEIDHEEGCLSVPDCLETHQEETEGPGPGGCHPKARRLNWRPRGFWPLPCSMRWIISMGSSSWTG